MKSKIAIIGASIAIACLSSTAFAADHSASKTAKQKVVAQISSASEMNRAIESNPNTKTGNWNAKERANLAAMDKMLADLAKARK